MTMGELNSRYFNWMYQLVCGDRYSKDPSYKKLLHRLHEIDFYYTIPMDGNRETDGMDLRYRFGDENHYSQPMVASYLDNRPCSVLEMMVALSIRCEDIMEDPNIGDRTGQWFWNMIVSLGLGSMTDSHFSKTHTDEIVSRFLNREYQRDGAGGLFTIHKLNRDMRAVEIWGQMCWYLAEEEGI